MDRRWVAVARVTEVGDKFFPYHFDKRFKALLWPLGARVGKDGVTLTEDKFCATFGHWKLETPLSNVKGAHVTRDYEWFKAIGMRLSFVDSGLTFGTNTKAGVCVHFVEPAPKVIGLRDHAAITVTVEDCEGLVDLLGLDEPPT